MTVVQFPHRGAVEFMPPRRKRDRGYLMVMFGPNGDRWWVDHWATSGDSCAWVAGPFSTEQEASKAAAELSRQMGCEVQS